MPAAVKWVDPSITVKDVARSAAWYSRMLGLKAEATIPDAGAPSFVRLTNGDVAFMITDGSDAFSGRRATKATLDAVAARKAQRVVSFYFRVEDDIDSLYRSVRRKGAKVVRPLAAQPYGMRDFMLRDPDGYDVSVGQDIPQ